MVTHKAHLWVRILEEFCCYRLMSTTQSLHNQGSLLLMLHRKTRHLGWLTLHLLCCLCQVKVESHPWCSMKFALFLQRLLRIGDKRLSLSLADSQVPFSNKAHSQEGKKTKKRKQAARQLQQSFQQLEYLRWFILHQKLQSYSSPGSGQ